MYFEEVTIKNFRNISDMNMRFKPGMNLIIGDNGAGKTSILSAMAISLSGYLKGFQGLARRSIEPGEMTENAVEETSITPTIRTNDGVFSWEVFRPINDSTNYRKVKPITKYAYTQNALQETLPVISFQGIDRVASEGSTIKNGKLKTFPNRIQGYDQCQSFANRFKTIEEWCLRMEIIGFRNPNENISEYYAFQRATEIFLQFMMNDDPTQVGHVYYDRKKECLAYKDKRNAIRISALSSGLQSILHIVMDIAYRMAQLNPGCPDFIDIPGIVMIDEVDVHLHPKWQWRILGALHQTFPSVQFIITTHAPIVIASYKDAHLISVDDAQQVSYLPSAYAYSADAVLSGRQNSSGMKAEMSDAISRFDQQLNLGNLPQAKAELQSMEDEFGYDNPSVVEARAEYALESISLEE